MEPVEIAVAVVERDGSFLIGLRREGQPLAGYWEFPGGKVHPGETAADAAVRECLEETGLAVRVKSEYPAVAHTYAHGTLRLRFFACELTKEGALESDSRFRWVPRGELTSYEFPAANQTLLVALQASVC